MARLKDYSVSRKIMLIEVISVFFLIALCVYSLNSQRISSLEDRKDKLSSLVENAVSTVKYFHQLSDEIGESQAQQQAKSTLAAMRFDNNNYFWITDSNSKTLMHPLKPGLVGQDGSTMTDGNGKYYMAEMTQLANREGAGYVEYSWRSPSNELYDKISYIERMPEWGWIIGTGILVEDINTAFWHDVWTQVPMAFVAGFLLIVATYFIGRNITQPLNRLVEQLNAIADGDIRIRMNEDRKDEIGILCRKLDSMLDSIHKTLRLSMDSAVNSSDMAKNIAVTTEQSAANTESQRIQLEQLATSMNEMTVTIADVAQNSEKAAANTDQVVSLAQSSGEHMKQTAKQVNRLAENVEIADSLVDKLRHGVTDISDVVMVIQGISEQTNLLALNAAIEAARAGDQGRGFAVVADEVRGLASRTKDSTGEIQSTIEALIASAKLASEAMQACHAEVSSSVESVSVTHQEIEKMVEELHASNDMIAQIASASEEQGVVAEEVNSNVGSIHHSGNEISVAASALAEQSHSLAELSADLNEQLKFFKV
ncbi:methyl-accepting chemotaxis protein [Photobacterium sp. SDRW27]|uniref:methyl-accepting chemotaxis protein n=1 Tax=Photobacterium obscurum TaxID=2829490 RepID=UPI00224442C3|nr:methyl-accepting chemotaxis protein [Photobacterium obscurum]MCW8330159.1 methyl-accepting chemotaxis protein [Photobacterium obscurum]